MTHPASGCCQRNLGGEKDQHGEPDRNYSGVLKLLGALLASDANAAEKKRLLQEEYHIPMTRTIEEEVSKMYPFSQYIEARGYQKGNEERAAFDIKRLMKNSGWPFEKAAAMLDLPREEWSSYAKLIEQPSDVRVPG